MEATATPHSLPSSFFVDSQNSTASKPTLRQRKALDLLRARGFELLKMSELRAGLKKIFDLTKNLVITSDDTDDFAACILSTPTADVSVPTSLFPHPYFWKRLGFTCEYPEQDFLAYVEPVLNKWDRVLMTPANSRWGGGFLMLDALLYFLQHPNELTRRKSLEIFEKRARISNKRSYRIIIVAMEIARSLGLVLYLFSTVEFQPGAVPVQPNVAPTPPFFSDFLDTVALKKPERYYPMRTWWKIVQEGDVFLRLFSLSFLVFDFFFETAYEDPQAALQRTGNLVEEFLNTSDSLSEVEARARDFIAHNTTKLKEEEKDEMVEEGEEKSREISHTVNEEL